MKNLNKVRIIGILLMIISILIAIMTENNIIETIAGFTTALGLIFTIVGKIE